MMHRILQANEGQKTTILRFLRLLEYPAFADEFMQAVRDGLSGEPAIVAFITEWEARA